MRRCPVCDFIYEDDEILCLMDGTGLVNYSGALAFEESALPKSAPPTNSYSRGLTLIASGVILAIVLFLYFHNVARRNALQSNPGAAKTYNSSQPRDQNPNVVIPVETAPPLISPTPFNRTPPKTDSPRGNNRVLELNDNTPLRAVQVESATPLPRPLPSLTPTSAKIDVPSDKSASLPVKPDLALPASRPSATPPREVKPTDKNLKNESKLKSFFKKAGNVLKKPFKQ